MSVDSLSVNGYFVRAEINGRWETTFKGLQKREELVKFVSSITRTVGKYIIM